MSTRETWVCELVGHWQSVVGFRSLPRESDLDAALTFVLEFATPPHDPLERLLLRGFMLDVGLLLSSMADTAPTEERGSLRQLARQLCDVGPLPADHIGRVASLQHRLHETSPQSPADELAARARACIDERPTRYATVSRLARELGTNHWDLARSFRHAFHVTVGQYLRSARTAAALATLRHVTAVKGVASSIGCSDATLRRLVRRHTGAAPKSIVRCRV